MILQREISPALPRHCAGHCAALPSTRPRLILQPVKSFREITFLIHLVPVFPESQPPVDLIRQRSVRAGPHRAAFPFFRIPQPIQDPERLLHIFIPHQHIHISHRAELRIRIQLPQLIPFKECVGDPGLLHTVGEHFHLFLQPHRAKDCCHINLPELSDRRVFRAGFQDRLQHAADNTAHIVLLRRLIQRFQGNNPEGAYTAPVCKCG